jgi:hypothetical protein
MLELYNPRAQNVGPVPDNRFQKNSVVLRGRIYGSLAKGASRKNEKGPLTNDLDGKGPAPADQKEHIANREQIGYSVPSNSLSAAVLSCLSR